jgi:class 3 adenylate cyclase
VATFINTQAMACWPYFGYPTAHDNDAERAVLAGLDIVEGTQRLAAELRQRGDEAIAVRVGIHTGIVVVGEMGAGNIREVHAIGETPNVAARIQGEAAADSVCISAATARLLGPRFPDAVDGRAAAQGRRQADRPLCRRRRACGDSPEAKRPAAALVGA